MGEAKRRSAEISKLKEAEKSWRESLSDQESEILLLAKRLDERLVRGRQFSEGCYHLAFFMTHYLSNKNIEVTPIIGWVNDGAWEGLASHAWIEFEGKKIDASLTYTSHGEAQPTGNLIVLDHVLRKGAANYTYYKNDDPAVKDKLDWMKSIPEFKDVFSHKETEHQEMMAIANDNKIKEYLSLAPQGGRYKDIADLIEQERP